MKKTERYFKVKSYVGVVVPKQASGHFNFRICHPSKDQQSNCTSGEVSMFGNGAQPKTNSTPINTDYFKYAKALISNDDSRKINVGFNL